jgi:D-glycero-alpha-D-manno-heptose 1-phosphate guanylyltransferase
MEREAVILAGGLGTRLRGVIDDLPKSMAPVKDRPFLGYILDQLSRHRITRAILAAGYRNEDIIAFFGNRYKEIELVYSVESEPLGTGGAILKAAESINSDSFLVLNGDTLFDIDLEDFRKSFKYSNASLSVALKPMVDFERYGSVNLKGDRIISFNEKKYCSEGLINGGIYIINSNWLKAVSPAEKFSFEKDIMEKRVLADKINGYISDTYFIDIGIPEDYERAQKELPQIFSLIR